MNSLDRLKRLLRKAAANGEIKDHGDLKQEALAFQSLLAGLCLMSEVVRSEEERWAGTELTLRGLGLYPSEDAPLPDGARHRGAA